MVHDDERHWLKTDAWGIGSKPLYFEDDHKAAPFDDLVFDFEIEDDDEYFDEFEMDELDDEPLNNYSPVEGLNLAQASRASS